MDTFSLVRNLLPLCFLLQGNSENVSSNDYNDSKLPNLMTLTSLESRLFAAAAGGGGGESNSVSTSTNESVPLKNLPESSSLPPLSNVPTEQM